jgi:hypothetical protein
MQLIYNISTDLLDYRNKTEKSIWKFPDFSEKCPICHGKDCVVKHGFYKRLIIDLKKGYFFNILIIRYKCRRVLKPKNNIKDRTFSLLPHELIPYLSLTINSLMIIVINSCVSKKTIKEIQRLVEDSQIDEDRIYNIDIRHIKEYILLFRETYFKLNQFINKHNIRAGPFRGGGEIDEAIIFLKSYKNGFPGFSLYYYETEGGYIKNAWFLFGKPYQAYSF